MLLHSMSPEDSLESYFVLIWLKPILDVVMNLKYKFIALYIIAALTKYPEDVIEKVWKILTADKKPLIINQEEFW